MARKNEFSQIFFREIQDQICKKEFLKSVILTLIFETFSKDLAWTFYLTHIDGHQLPYFYCQFGSIWLLVCLLCLYRKQLGGWKWKETQQEEKTNQFLGCPFGFSFFSFLTFGTLLFSVPFFIFSFWFDIQHHQSSIFLHCGVVRAPLSSGGIFILPQRQICHALTTGTNHPNGFFLLLFFVRFFW